MSASLIQEFTPGRVASGANAITASAATTIGNLVLVLIELGTGTASLTALAGSGLTLAGWTLLADSGSHNTTARSLIYGAFVTSADNTITATPTTGASSVHAIEFSSNVTLTTDVASVTGQATTGTSRSVSITPTSADVLVLAIAGHLTAQAVTPPSSPWNATADQDAAVPTLDGAYQLDVGAGTYTALFSWTTTGGNSGAIIALQITTPPPAVLDDFSFNQNRKVRSKFWPNLNLTPDVDDFLATTPIYDDSLAQRYFIRPKRWLNSNNLRNQDTDFVTVIPLVTGDDFNTLIKRSPKHWVNRNNLTNSDTDTFVNWDEPVQPLKPFKRKWRNPNNLYNLTDDVNLIVLPTLDDSFGLRSKFKLAKWKVLSVLTIDELAPIVSTATDDFYRSTPRFFRVKRKPIRSPESSDKIVIVNPLLEDSFAKKSRIWQKRYFNRLIKDSTFELFVDSGNGRLPNNLKLIFYPSNLPQLFESGATESLSDDAIRSQVTAKPMQQGAMVGRIRYTTVVGEMFFTTTQKNAFEVFYRTVIAHGSLKFKANFDNTGLTKNYKLTKPPRFTPVGEIWIAQLEVAIVDISGSTNAIVTGSDWDTLDSGAFDTLSDIDSVTH